MPRPRAPASAADLVAAKLAAQGISAHQVDPDYLSHLQHLHPNGDSSADLVAARLAAQGISAHQVDPDYLSHLQHLHPDGDSSADLVAAKLAAQGISAYQVDPDYLSHLQHLHPGGHSSALERPARGRPGTPPHANKCEQPEDGEARSAPLPSPAPEGGDRPVEEKKLPAEIPGNETADMDEHYSTFWRHTRVVDDMLVFEMDGEVLSYGQVDRAAGTDKKDGEEAAAWAASGENGGGVRKEKGKGKRKVGRPALKARVHDSPPHWQKGRKEKKGAKNGGKKIKVMEEEEDQGRGVKNRAQKNKSRMRDYSPAHRQKSKGEKDGGENGAEKIKEEEEEEKVPVISTGRPPLNARVLDSPAHWQQGWKEKKGVKNGAKKIKLEDDEEKPSRGLPVKTLNTVNRERNSRHDAEPHVASGLDGVVWPTHIMERPDSEFKERLIRVLRKPFSQGEYDMLLGNARIRLPATKKRQTRSGVKYYDSTHERVQSYFDCHPDLAKQVRVESTSKPNQLALLRGFFFWMENITNEDQFRPWSDDFKLYKIME
ncbi:ABC transporter F family member 4-like isoform X1 [Triticum urartu]|uniref:Uncharacterized protein n=1 Tax=Triticum urartu TaxID=4572 RepID=A0A8R7PIN3_TRIUA|nr:ABC transporter F family member 4-like isoform X1 [Triticum urartu]